MLLALHEIWPHAPFYTAVYDKKRAPWAKDLNVKPSFLQHIPYAKTHHEVFPWLTPLAFEAFSFDAFDVVVTITSAEAKYIITKAKTLHICYCLTPTRYLWHEADQYMKNPGIGISDKIVKIIYSSLAPTLRRWDRIGSARPDNYIAISKCVEARIHKYYQRPCESVIYPPVDTKKFTVHSLQCTVDHLPKDYFLVVSRLVSGKRIELIIDAFNILGLPLAIIGRGKMRAELENRVKKNIHFITHYLTDDELVGYYGNCRALIHAGDEDFGISAVEAQSCGTPVIAYRKSGLIETVRDGITGLFFSDQTSESIVKVVQKFMTMSYKGRDCVENAKRFSKERFQRDMKQTIEHLYEGYRAANL